MKNEIVLRFRHEQMLLPAAAQLPARLHRRNRIAYKLWIVWWLLPRGSANGSSQELRRLQGDIGHQIRRIATTAAPIAPAPPAPASKTTSAPSPLKTSAQPRSPASAPYRKGGGSSSISAATVPSTKTKGSTLRQTPASGSGSGYDMGKHKHHRAFCDLAGLQRPQPRQHQPPLATVIILRHEQQPPPTGAAISPAAARPIYGRDDNPPGWRPT